VSQCQTNCTSNLLFTTSSNMFPISLPLTLILLLWTSLFLPLTTALPLPYAKSILEAHICLNLDFSLDAANLELSGGATCALYSYVSIKLRSTVSSNRFVQSSPKHHRQHQALTLLFPNSAPSFTGDPPISSSSTTRPAKEASGRKEFRSDLRRSSSITKRRRRNTKRNTITSSLADSPPQPYAESIQAGTGDAKLTPWKPPASAGPPKDSDWCGGDGPYYANGNGCIGPGRKARDVGGIDD